MQQVSVKYPIRRKLIVFIVIPIVLVYCTIMAIQLRMELTAARKDAFDDLANAVAHQAKACEMTLMTVSKVAHGLADFMIVRNPDSIDEITAFIKQMLITNPSIIGSTVAFQPDAFPVLPRQTQDGTLSPYLVRETEIINGNPVETYAYKDLALVYKDKKYLDWEWYAEPAKLQKPCWSEPYFDEGGGNVLMCTYSVPFSIDGKFSGVATIDVSLDEIREIIQNISTEKADYILCSPTGRIIVAPQHLDWEMHETIESISDKFQAETIRAASKNMARGERGIYFTKSQITGQNIFGAYEPLKMVGWSILIRTHESDVLSYIYRQLFITAIMCGIGLTIIVSITLVVAQKITSPLHRLISGVRTLSAGNWDVEITGITSQDEFGELAQTFNTMASSLRASIDDAVRHATAREVADAGSLAKSQFLATMSHEMRTPLNGVIGISDLLMETPLRQKQREYAQLIKASGKSLLFLINDILDFSKIEAGKFELSPSVFNLQKMVDTVLRILASRAEEKQLELVTTVKRNVPPRVFGDEGRLRQILINLVGNALKFTEAGGVRINVSLVSQTETQFNIRFDVIDTGVGIPPEKQGRLFKLFSQADASTAKNYGGTGLGLAISKKLVELMDGEIHVESDAGKGATFTFNVSLGMEPVGEDSGSMTKLMLSRTSYRINGQPVLIVTSSPFQRPVLMEQFEAWNFKTKTVSSSAEALAELREAEQAGKPFFQTVIDTQLPDGTGENLIRSIQQDAVLSKTPMIYLVPLSDDSSQKPWVYPETLQFVSKPIQNTTLYGAATASLLNKDEIKSSGIRRVPTEMMKNLRVLIAEDNKINQIVIGEILKNAEVSYEVVANGEEAFAQVKTGKFNIVLMDCQMPILDGYDASRQIRIWEEETRRKRIPIIALTANATMEDETRCLAAGMDAYCSKPVEPQRVIELLQEWGSKSAGV
ncbi:hypothetical protein FACS1894170_09410 [Planctomycetales bacterium]|nr:hypothetical protein FACS1894170_09410 [Planctomycetales bacterium]